jgi:maltokinase
VTDRLAVSSYPADAALLAELRAAWPPPAPSRANGRGYVAADLSDDEPAVALRLGDRFAVALVAEPAGSFEVVPLTRDDVLVTSWRQAIPGDGLSAFVAGVPMASEHRVDVDQTNASVVVGERAIVKWLRRVGPAPSRAATLLAHLDAVGFREMAAPLGSLTWIAPDGTPLTLAQGDAFLPGARDGWDWCVERLERHIAHGDALCPVACDPWIGERLGRLVGRLHAALTTPSEVITDPAGSADTATVAGWRADAFGTIDEALRLTADQDPVAGAALAVIEPAMRADLDLLPADRSVDIRPVHGDLHVGQILEWSSGLAVIDFDGNPTLGAAANALRQAPERDIAQMLSSLDHVGRIVAARSERDARQTIDAWIARTRRDFLATLDPDPALLAAFEVEQECRELVYAARFLPRWRYAPLATLRARYG